MAFLGIVEGASVSLELVTDWPATTRATGIDTSSRSGLHIRIEATRYRGFLDAMGRSDTVMSLLERWKKAEPQTCTTEAVERWLEKEFRAYEIPLAAISSADYRNDEEVREVLIYKLYTITHPEVLQRLYSEEEKAMKDCGPEAYEDYWKSLFLDRRSGAATVRSALPDASWLAYNLLTIQHALGQRTSVVLEREGDQVTGAKVYGTSDYLSTVLVAVTGFREAGADERNYYSMVTGDVNDVGFNWYLDCLARHGMI